MNDVTLNLRYSSPNRLNTYALRFNHCALTGDNRSAEQLANGLPEFTGFAYSSKRITAKSIAYEHLENTNAKRDNKELLERLERAHWQMQVDAALEGVDWDDVIMATDELFQNRPDMYNECVNGNAAPDEFEVIRVPQTYDTVTKREVGTWVYRPVSPSIVERLGDVFYTIGKAQMKRDNPNQRVARTIRNALKRGWIDVVVEMQVWSTFVDDTHRLYAIKCPVVVRIEFEGRDYI